MSRYLFGILLAAATLVGCLTPQAPLFAGETAQTTQPPPAGGDHECERPKPEPKTS